ncbi:MAG: hypothetical protein JW726_01650 [Anaerolineales bacterium]|nr:hypothetical protein [Anaerolineales bacterium]
MTTTGIILMAVFSAAIGFLLGGLVVKLSKREAKSPKGLDTLPSPDGAPSQFEEDVRLMRDRRSHSLLIEISGKLFHHASQLDTASHQRVRAVLNDLQPWLEPGAQSKPTSAPVAETPLPFVQTPEVTVKPVNTNIIDAAARALSSPSTPPPQYKSIAAQINDILQEMIKGTAIAEHGVFISESPDKGVIVHVGQESFPGVDAVPYPKIRDLIRQAAGEWERRTKRV